MCNRFRITADRAELTARYGLDAPYPPDLELPPPELFPKTAAWIVREEAGRRVPDVATWGFPHVVAGTSGKPVTRAVTNVRNYESRFWRSALADPGRRCLVPFTAFCEWEGEKGAKVARWFDVPSEPIVSFAGVWRPVEGGGRVMAFLTCDPNPLVAKVHPKAMPVLLAREDEAGWLEWPVERALGLAQPYPSQLMRIA